MISYIVPIYNAERYLKDCVTSILKCAASGDEVILIDDGSTDASGDICDWFRERYSCVIVEHLKNGGVSHARNRGIQLSKKDYIRFIDSDDEVIPILTQTNSDCLVMDAEVTNEYRRLIRKVRMGKENRVYTPMELLSDLSSANKQCLLHYLWNHLYKRSLINENHLMFDETVALGEDFLFNCEYLACCKTVEYMSTVCYRYFVRNSNTESLTRKFHKNELERRRKMDKAFLKLIEMSGCDMQSRENAKRLIGEITIGSLESIATKNTGVSNEYIKSYMQNFYDTEYYDYIMNYLSLKTIGGKSEAIEYALIRKKSCIALYYYVRIRSDIRKLKNRGKK